MTAVPHAVERIAVVRANALGDFVVTLPALDALRARYPEAEIVLIGREWHADLLDGRPSPVDRVVVAPAPPGDAGDGAPAEAHRRFFAAMRAERFDVALQLHGGGQQSNVFTRRLGARTTAGMQAPGAPPLDRVVPYVYYQPEVLRLLEAVALVDAGPVRVDPVLAVTGADVDASLRGLPDDGRPLAVLHPGATDPRRRWPAERFARIGDALHERGLRVVITGTDPEAHLTGAVAAAMDRPADDVGGRLALGALVGLLSRASIVVANDTGPRHLAAAVGTATVGLYWVGNLINAGPVTRRLHRSAVSWRTTCPVCGSNCTGPAIPTGAEDRCPHNPSFLDSIEPQTVWAHVDDLLTHWVGREDGAAFR